MTPSLRVSRIAYAAFTCACLLVVAAFVSACGADGSAAPADSGGLPTVTVETRWASGEAADLSALVRATGTVFVGQVTAERGERFEDLAAGLKTTADGPRPGAFPVTLFDVQVERALAGNVSAGSSVVVEQAGGVFQRADGSRARLVLDADEPLAVGKTYLFLARPAGNGSGDFVTAPFSRLEVSGESLKAPARWSETGAPQQLSGLRLDEAAAEISSEAQRQRSGQ